MIDFEKQVAKQQEINKTVHESMKNSNAIHKQFFNAIQSLEAQVKRLEAANIELLKERAALDAKYLQWTQSIHDRLERLEG